jgi:hypothetical protein
MNGCNLPYTCGICICNPAMCSVGVGAATANPGFPAGGGSVGQASCGMSQVTVSAGPSSNVVLWLLGGAAVLYALRKFR